MRKFLNKVTPLAGGLLFFLLLFLYGFVNNLSLSYMGNTSKTIVSLIFQNFLGHIIFYVVLVFSTYLIIGFIIVFMANKSIEALLNIFNVKLGKYSISLLNTSLTVFIFLLFFLKDLILYPQLYMNNFYNKNAVFKNIVDFLTTNATPDLFTVLQVLTFFLMLTIITASLFKRGNKNHIYVIAIAIIISGIVYYSGKINPIRNHQKAPNVLIMATDALRPDHMSGYGYNKNTTPNIDKIISDGVRFTNAYIEVPRTFPSWITYLTGEFASTHGVRHMFPTSRDINRDFNSIVKVFKKDGYYTAVTADYAGDIFGRVDLGFEDIDTPTFNFNTVIEQAILENHAFLLPFLSNGLGTSLFPVLRDSAYFCPPDAVKSKIIEKINKSGDRPFFITSFFSATHFPYAPPFPYYKTFSKKGYKGDFKYFKQRIISLESDKKESLSDEDIEQVRALYDGGIMAFDDAVGGIIDYLKKCGILENTIIVIMSDHGENLYEEGLGMGHGEHFRGQFAIKVPLIMRYPSFINKGSSVDNIVRSVDFAPTLLDILGKKPIRPVEGVSLVPLMKGNSMPAQNSYGETGIWFDNSQRDDLFFQKLRILYPDITALSELDTNFNNQVVLNDNFRDIINLAKHRYVYDGRYKLIYMPLVDRIEYELYDLKNDPFEKNNIAAADPANLNRLKTDLFKWASRNDDIIIKNDFIFPVLRY